MLADSCFDVEIGPCQMEMIEKIEDRFLTFSREELGFGKGSFIAERRKYEVLISHSPLVEVSASGVIFDSLTLS